MKIVFMGTPVFAKVCLQGLIENGHNVVGVITQPDRPAGRGKQMQASPVKLYAVEHGIPVYQPERVNKWDGLAGLGADIFVVAAFGQILSRRVLDTPPLGAINVHASILPKFRGAAPIQAAILAGEEVTGITIMQMDAGMDTGEMLLKSAVAITPCDTGGTLHDKMCDIAAPALLAALAQIAAGEHVPIKQDGALATYAPIISKQMTKIDLNKTPKQIVDFVRGYNPFPGATMELDGKTIKVWHVCASHIEPTICPKRGIHVQASGGTVEIIELTPPGGKKMSGIEFARGMK